MNILKGLILLKKQKRIIYKEGSTTKKEDPNPYDIFKISLNGAVKENFPEPVACFIPTAYTSELGWDYRVNAAHEIFSVTKLRSEYTAHENSLFGTYPELRPVESLRIPTGEGDITAKGQTETWIEDTPENFDLFVTTKNASGAWVHEKKYVIESKVNPKPYQDFLKLENLSACIESEQSNYS